MKLTIKERLMMGSLYPKKGNMLSQMMIKDIQKKVNIDQKEREIINLRTSQIGSLQWHVNENYTCKDCEKDFTVTVEGHKEWSKERKCPHCGSEKIKFNGINETEVEIEFAEAELTFLKEQVDRLDTEKAITQDILSLCVKIKG